MKRALAIAIVTVLAIALNHRNVLEMGKSLDSYHGRLVAWRIGLEVWWEHFRVFGSGAGGWTWYIPQWADRFKQLGAHEAFLNPHSLPIGLLFEQGLVGVILAVMVVWGHRRTLVRSPVAWALLILSLASFPLYVAQVAGPALVALAITWREPWSPSTSVDRSSSPLSLPRSQLVRRSQARRLPSDFRIAKRP